MGLFTAPRRSSPGKPRTVGDPALALAATALAVAVVLGLCVYIAIKVGTVGATSNPVETFAMVALGKIKWTVMCTVVLVLEVLVIVAVLLTIAVAAARRRRDRFPIDATAELLAHGRELNPLREKAARQLADRVGIAPELPPGLTLGSSVAGKHGLFQNYEACACHIWGPRRGKTSTQAIPAIVDAPGPVLATTNKFDALLQSTREWRARKGRVYVFDIQQIAGERATFWWNPLTYVVDDVTAENLCAVFAGSEVVASSGGSSAFFTKAAARLLKALLRAAAVGKEPITIVLEWLTNHEQCIEAVEHLTNHGLQDLARQVMQQMKAPEKQRGGVYETAANWMACVGMDTVRPWITDPGDGTTPHLDLDEFVRSTDTLYCLSRNAGAVGAGQVVAALVQAVCDAAEAYASRSGGRMPVPLVGVLDEAANVVRWHRLPEVYSYYGSQGILLQSYFQSYEQGAAAFGREQMDMLWDSANLRVFGGGVASTRFLEDLVKLAGDYNYRQTSHSENSRGGGGSRSTQIGDKTILTIADLASLPFGRALVFASGMRAALIRTPGWYEDPARAELQQAIDDGERRVLTLEAA